MFDIDQDVEILAVIQAANTYRERESQEINNVVLFDLRLKLDRALSEVVKIYGKEILTYTGV